MLERTILLVLVFCFLYFSADATAQVLLNAEAGGGGAHFLSRTQVASWVFVDSLRKPTGSGAIQRRVKNALCREAGKTNGRDF